MRLSQSDNAHTSKKAPGMAGGGTGLRLRRQRGQSLIVAVIVMFVLLFIGAIFVALVARNLQNTGRARDTSKADALANAGINYADYYLMNSPLGADWRPAPEDLNYLNPPSIGQNDPDRLWLLDGYSRIQMEGGRALVKVTMKPDPRQPLGKYIEIRSIGRVGDINIQDPTTFLNTPAPRLRRELVAYKQIGLTDYLRFVTNKNKDSKFKAELGLSGMTVPAWLQFGGLPVRTFPAGTPPPPTGAPMRVNGTLKLWNNVTIALDRNNWENGLVAGEIEVEPHVPNDPLHHGATIKDMAAQPGFVDPSTLPLILPSSNPNYSTFNGMLRDDGPNPDPNGYARLISYLNPPLLDWAVPVDGGAGTTTRYRLLTRNSGQFVNGFNTGFFGMGRGIYVDNFGSTDRETQTAPGGASMRSTWLNPRSNSSSWNGPYFIPPGAFIEFGYPVVQERNATDSSLIADQFAAHPGFRIVRDGSDRFRDPTGRTAPAELPFTFFIYKPANQAPVLKVETEFFRSYLRDVLNMAEYQIDKFLPPFNGVVYAEGNIRVRGLLPAVQNIPIRREADDPGGAAELTTPPTDAQIREMISPAMTLVSGDNIYIEGSIVREDAKSMLALLATEYVVVNTTMFVGPNKSFKDFISLPGTDSGPYGKLIGTNEASATPPYTLDWLFGDDPQLYTNANGQVPVNLYVNHVNAGTQHTYVNFFINDWAPRSAGPPVVQPLYPFNAQNPAPPPATLPPFVYEYPDLQNLATPGERSVYGQRVFQLTKAAPLVNPSYVFTGDPNYQWPRGLRNSFRPALEVNFTSSAGTSEYAIARTAVMPMDVRIEAVMYAQNGSFFIIPGVPLNENERDTRDAAIRKALAYDPGAPAGSMLRAFDDTDPMFPFYGEPIDCRITIVGAISENRTASIGDQSEWMRMWGYIPRLYGSSGFTPVPNANNEREIPTAHLRVDEVGLNNVDQRTQAEVNANITRGIRFLYDPALVAPYAGYNPAAGRPFRDDLAHYDQANLGGFRTRTLPPVPRLPVCPGFIFRGEVR